MTTLYEHEVLTGTETFVGPPSGIWEACIEQAWVAQPEIIKDYLGRHGLSELPTPVWVDAENALVWHRDHRGRIDSTRHRLQDYSGANLGTILERDFWLAPPEIELRAQLDSDAAENDPAPANPFAGEGESDAVSEDSTAQGERATTESTENKVPSTTLKCTMKHKNGRTCGKTYKSKGWLNGHQRKVHWEAFK
jgi:hypothetical protein